jgi:hypothetical protein
VLAGVALSAAQSSNRAPALTDAAFSDFLNAPTAREAVAVADRIVASGVGFEEAFARLRRGRVYSRDVPRGVVEQKYRSETGEYFYTLDVPQGYDPTRAYPDRTRGSPASNRSTSCRTRGETHRGGPNGRWTTCERFSIG